MTEQFIGRYRVLCRLGAGGMAEVFLASATGEQGFEKRVAIKRIHEELRLEGRHVQAFADEARLLAQLNHPNIVQVFSFEHDGSSHFLVMEYVEGVPLSKALRLAAAQELHLPLSAALSVGVQVCEALDYAHTARSYDGSPMHIVHRDIKPANLLLTAQGRIKVTDFGIARAATNLHQTATGSGKGTLAYMAPEQLDARPVGPPADLFSLGAVLFELITGRLLFEFTDWAAFMERRQLGLRPQDLEALRRAAPQVVPVLIRALEQSPDDRFASAAEMGSALRSLDSYAGREPLRTWASTLTSTEITLGEVPPTQTASRAPTPTVADPLPGTGDPAATPTRGGDDAPATRRGRGLAPSWWAALASTLAAVILLVVWHPWSGGGTGPGGPVGGDGHPALGADGAGLDDPEAGGGDAAATDEGGSEWTQGGAAAVDGGGTAPAADGAASTDARGDGPAEDDGATAADPTPDRPDPPTPEPPTPEPPTPEPPPPEIAAVVATGEGSLSVTTFPWAKIYVDGQIRGDGDPVRGLKLPLGSHTIRVSRDDPDHPVPDLTIEIDLTRDGEDQAWTFELPEGRHEWTARRLQ